MGRQRFDRNLADLELKGSWNRDILGIPVCFGQTAVWLVEDVLITESPEQRTAVNRIISVAMYR